MSTSTFHFCSGIPDNSMFTDIQSLNKLSQQKFASLVEIVIRYLTNPSKASNLLEDLHEFAAESKITSTALRNVVKTFLSVPKGATKRNVGPTQLQEDFNNLGLSEEYTAHFMEQWVANQVLLSRSALSQALVVNQLVDMEWKFGVTAASSEVDKLGNTFLQLKLVINTGSGPKSIYMELTLPQFYSFLHEMERAKASVQYFT